MADELQILTMLGKSQIATKQFDLVDGNEINISYSRCKHFDASSIFVDSLDDLSVALVKLEECSSQLVIRGTLKEGKLPRRLRRLLNGPLANFETCSRQWLFIDIDNLELPDKWSDFNNHVDAIVEHTTNHLPSEFHRVDTHWQFSSSMGIKEGIRIHLWFWLSRPISDVEAETWLSDAKMDIDMRLYNPVQIHYTATPIFSGGRIDPVHTRSGIRRFNNGLDTVPVPGDLNERAKKFRRVRRSTGSSLGNTISKQAVRDKNDLVVDGREGWLYWQSVLACRELTKGTLANSKLLTVDEITSKTWDLFSSSADISDDKWTITDAREKAIARHQSLEDGWKPNSRSHTTSLIPDTEPYFQLDQVTVDEGQQQLENSLSEFFHSVSDGETNLLALRVTMGLGKTTIAAEKLNELIALKPALNVEVYIPRHNLIDEFIDKISDATHDLVSVVHVWGRNHTDGAEKPICENYDLVEAYEKASLPVYSNVCYKSDTEKCKHYDGCAYINQFEPTPAGSIRVFPHSYLGLERSNKLSDPDLIIIDESFIPALHQKLSVLPDEVREFVSDQVNPTAGNIIADTLRTNGMLLAELRENGVTAKWFNTLNIRPKDNVSSFGQRSAQVKKNLKNNEFGKLRTLRAICEVLAEELNRHPERDDVTRLRYDPKDKCIVVDRLRSLPLSIKSSLLVLDATADPSLVERVAPGILFERIDVEQIAVVTQVYDRTGSNLSWGQEDKVDELKLVLEERARYGERLLCVSHKALADDFRQEVFSDIVSFDHFNNLRGTDQYKDCETIIITGRNQPPQADVDGFARAIWWDDDAPLTHDEAAILGAPPEVDLSTEVRGYLTADPDDAAGVNVRAFTDPRIEAVHQQIREAETIQGIARLRLVRAEKPKNVFLLANLPIEIRVDRLVAWNELMPDEADVEFLEHGNIPLTPKGLEIMRPDLVSNSDQAKNFMKRTHLSDVGSLTSYSPPLERLDRMVVSFQLLKDGKPFGRTEQHLFKVPNLDGPTPTAEWQSFLENGDPQIPDTGWGPIEITGLVPAPPPNEMVNSYIPG